MNKEEFIKYLNLEGIILKENQLNQLEIYKDFLIEYNKNTNLTTITDEKDIYLKHFYDSLTIRKVIDLSKYNNLIDVGTGAGFPGMVLAITYPNLNVTLLDSNNKKIKFLEELKEKLNIDNVSIINDRSEEYALNNIDKYDIVTSRAVANMRVLTELCLPMVKVGGYFIPLKSNVEEELKEAKKIVDILKGSIIKIEKFNLPVENSLRNILLIKKINKNPKGYPRNYNKIKKG